MLESVSVRPQEVPNQQASQAASPIVMETVVSNSAYLLEAETPLRLCLLGSSMWSLAPRVLCVCVLDGMLRKHQQPQPSVRHNDSHSGPCSGPRQGEPSQMEAALVDLYKRSSEAPLSFLLLLMFCKKNNLKKSTHPSPWWAGWPSGGGRLRVRCEEAGTGGSGGQEGSCRFMGMQMEMLVWMWQRRRKAVMVGGGRGLAVVPVWWSWVAGLGAWDRR